MNRISTTPPSSAAYASNVRTIGLIFLIGLAGFGWLYFSVMSQSGLAVFDEPLHTWLVLHRTLPITNVMEVITNVMAPTYVAIFSIAGALLWGWRKKEAWRPTLLIGAMGITLIVTAFFKDIIARERPSPGQMIPPLELDYSFPSGHTIGIAVGVFVLGYLLYSRTRSKKTLYSMVTLSIVGIALIALSRLYLGYHWLTDVSASVALALIILAAVMLIDRYKPKNIV
ncbi:MAG TPA: phosphatase PAP2 family protein [Candidatus Saccharimonadales bacterium]|nr:phosphatase PAP2 family protein [Candidatus Saccharimonadales bacterium]